MYYIKKRIIVSAAHKLRLNYESKCQELHDHYWIVTVYCKSKALNAHGMVVDFGDIKKEVMKLDHCVINEKVDFNPTTENLAKYICGRILGCYRVEVEESPDNTSIYEREV